MSDSKHHSNGVCLSCGGTVDENGMTEGGEVSAEAAMGELDSSSGPTGAESEENADDNVRDFARSLMRPR